MTPTQVFDCIEDGRAKGLDITADQHPYEAAESFMTQQLPDIFKDSDKLKPEYKTKEGRKEIKKAIETVFTYLDPSKIFVSFFPANTSFQGKSLEEIASIENKSPANCYVDLVCEDTPPMGIFYNRDMQTVRNIMTKDYIITASDGYTVPKDIAYFHPRSYGTFPRKIRKHVIEEKQIDLAFAIRSMTSLPAKKFKIKNRGKIAKGFYADIAIFDLKIVTDKATYENPHQFSIGIKHLLVNGVISIENGKSTGIRSGRSLRR